MPLRHWLQSVVAPGHKTNKTQANLVVPAYSIATNISFVLRSFHRYFRQSFPKCI